MILSWYKCFNFFIIFTPSLFFRSKWAMYVRLLKKRFLILLDMSLQVFSCALVHPNPFICFTSTSARLFIMLKSLLRRLTMSLAFANIFYSNSNFIDRWFIILLFMFYYFFLLNNICKIRNFFVHTIYVLLKKHEKYLFHFYLLKYLKIYVGHVCI